MKIVMMAALLAAQALAVPIPAAAAELATAGEQRSLGAFAGMRVRVGLDGSDRPRVRAGLTLAPTLRSQDVLGASRTRFGEGLELGVGERGPATLRLAGTRVDRLGMAPTGAAPEGRRAGVTSWGWVAIGTGVVALALGATYLWFEDAMECGPREC